MSNKANQENHTENTENNEPLQEDQASHEAVENAALPDHEAIIADLNDRLLRAAAEMQNIRRRTEMDVQKAKAFSIESFARDLLGVMDNLSRAADSISDEDAAAEPKLKTLKDGVEITKKELANVFDRHHVKKVGVIGEKFDHNIHQAMAQIEDKEKPAGTVIHIMQDGYIIKDRLIRPALVTITK